ncbi:MAG: hypothetical protein JWO12_3424 [Frankiales bacterium]|nr:hypothetical protein [Frankiales bacterium]
MTSTDLLALAPDWVTLRSATEDGSPIVVLVDRAVASAAPFADFPLQYGVAVQYGDTPDGLPTDTELPSLRALEQRLVDAAAGQARLVAVMTLEGVREWVLYAKSTEWALPFVDAGLSVVSGEDPTWHGLRELSGGV